MSYVKMLPASFCLKAKLYQCFLYACRMFFSFMFKFIWVSPLFVPTIFEKIGNDIGFELVNIFGSLLERKYSWSTNYTFSNVTGLLAKFTYHETRLLIFAVGLNFHWKPWMLNFTNVQRIMQNSYWFIIVRQNFICNALCNNLILERLSITCPSNEYPDSDL